MSISAMLRALKVIEEVMKLINNFEVHMYRYYHNIHTICIVSPLYNDYAGILEYPVSPPLIDWQLVYVVSVHTIDAMIDASPLNEYSSIKLRTSVLTTNSKNDA